MSVLLILASGAGLALQAYLGSFSRLLADDFCSIYFARRLGMLRYIWYWYLNWGGRYSAIAVDSVIRYLGSAGVRFVPVFVLAIWVTVTAVALAAILKKELGKVPGTLLCTAAAMTLVFAVLVVSPKVQQVLYWWNGMRTYVPALIVISFHAGFLYWASGRLDTRRKLVLGSLVSFAFAFFSGGFNETFTPIQFLLFAELLGLGILTRKLRFSDTLFYLLLAALLATTFSLLIMVMSPGLSIRQSYFTASPNLVTTLKISIEGYWLELGRLFSSVESVSTLLLVILASVWIGRTARDEKRPSGWSILLPVANGFLLSMASLVPSAQVTSEMPAPRTFIVPTFILVIGLAYAGLQAGKWWSKNTQSILALIQPMLVVCLLISAGLNARSLYANRDVYFNFARDWDIANAQILRAIDRGDADVTIQVSASNWAQVEVPTQNQKYWVNACYRLYYDIPVFGVQPELQP